MKTLKYEVQRNEIIITTAPAAIKVRAHFNRKIQK